MKRLLLLVVLALTLTGCGTMGNMYAPKGVFGAAPPENRDGIEKGVEKSQICSAREETAPRI